MILRSEAAPQSDNWIMQARLKLMEGTRIQNSSRKSSALCGLYTFFFCHNCFNGRMLEYVQMLYNN